MSGLDNNLERQLEIAQGFEKATPAQDMLKDVIEDTGWDNAPADLQQTIEIRQDVNWIFVKNVKTGATIRKAAGFISPKALRAAIEEIL